uniref:Uncharacterized protein n=1 Tax=Oryza sativa subsp. japonica TaxID=39947 RepID=Q6ZBT7_ORYSJ|nr:hypothetical protein [Oryza sativa Japonica Group]
MAQAPDLRPCMTTDLLALPVVLPVGLSSFVLCEDGASGASDETVAPCCSPLPFERRHPWSRRWQWRRRRPSCSHVIVVAAALLVAGRLAQTEEKNEREEEGRGDWIEKE